VEILDTLLKVSQAGSTVLLIIAVYGAAKGYWVPRWVLDESAKREAALWVLYEREKATTDRLLTRALQQDHPIP
jgi:hypothetical protein